MREKHFRIFARLIFASMLAIALSSVALAQRGGGGGHPGGGPGGGGPGMGGPGRSDTGFPTGVERGPRDGNSNGSDGGRRRNGGQDNSNRPSRDNSNNPDRDAHRLEGIAQRLNTTPDQLRSQYQAALAANPNLKFGQFIAANLIASNLNAMHTNITTAAILSGLASGKNLGETLQGLGLSADEAKEAERAVRKAGKHKS